MRRRSVLKFANLLSGQARKSCSSRTPTLQTLPSSDRRLPYRFHSSSSSSSSSRLNSDGSNTASIVHASNLAFWEKETTRLLATPIAAQEHNRIFVPLQHALQFWATQHTLLGVQHCWGIMDLAVEQIRASNLEESPSLVLWLDRSVNCWQHTPQSHLTGREILKRIDSYAPVVLPDIPIYGRIVHYVTKQHLDPVGGAQLGEELLERLERDNQNPGLKFYNILIHAHADSDLPEAPHKAEELLKRMQQVHSIAPDTYTFSGVLSAWAKNQTDPNAAQRADAILRKMEQVYDDGNTSVKPNTHTYSSVVAAFARHGQVEDAEATVQRMKQRYEMHGRDPEFLPNVVVFSALIDALAKSQKPGCVKRAEMVLQDMQDLSISTGVKHLRPNVVTFGAVFNALAQSGEPDAPVRAEALLQRMQVIGLNPNVAILSSVIHCWAKSKRKESGERAEAIIRRMQDLHQSGMDDVEPQLISFNAAMDCFVKSERKDTLERVQAMFKSLCDLYKGGNDALKPDVVTYTVLLDAVSRSRLSDAPDQAEAIFNEMKREGVLPNTLSYGMLINAWARSKRKEGPDKAVALFQEMERLVGEGQMGVKPDLHSYSGLLDCFAKQGDVRRAELLVKELEEKSQEGEKELAPSTAIYNSLLHACARSRSEQAVQRAEEILLRMSDGDSFVQPDAFSFSTAMAGLTNSLDPQAGKKTDRYLEHMKSMYQAGNERCKPNTVVYTAAIRAWSVTRHPDAVDRCFKIVEEMKELRDARAAPNNRTYHAVLTAISNSRRPDKLDLVRHVLAEMDERGLQPAIGELSECIRACSLSRDKAAYYLAEEIWEKIHDPSNTLRSNAYCCKNFLHACRNAGDPTSIVETVKKAYQTCCDDGFGQDTRVLGMARSVAPDVFTAQTSDQR